MDMAKKMMQAIQYDKYGGGVAALKLVEIPIPIPKKGEMLLKVEATSLNAVDWRTQEGMLRPFYPSQFPFIPGLDVAGEVVAIGPGVQNFKPGDKVVTIRTPKIGGGLAEYCLAHEILTATRPPEVSAAEGAGLPLSGLIALMALTETAGIKLDGTGPCKNILITTASGGIGHYAVQLAKLGNTHITATCGARNLDFVKSLGAHETIDYKTADGSALRSPSGKKYDVILHCGSPTPWSVFEPNLTGNGLVIDITPPLSSMLTLAMNALSFSRKKLVLFMLTVKQEKLRYLLDLTKEKKLTTVIDSRYHFSNVEDGWSRSMEGHATGKIIIEFGSNNVSKKRD